MIIGDKKDNAFTKFILLINFLLFVTIERKKEKENVLIIIF